MPGLGCEANGGHAMKLRASAMGFFATPLSTIVEVR
jgi:hypothetical protein